MARQRKEKKAKDIKLRQPDRSGPTEKTLLQLAEERELFKLADAKQRSNSNSRQRQSPETEEDDPSDEQHDDGLSLTAERVMETLLYSVTLTILHFTLDVLVQQQYAEDIDWYNIAERTTQALMGALPSASSCSFFIDSRAPSLT